MRTLLWKEWRQNWLVFVLGLLFVLLFPVIYAVHPRHLYVKAEDVPVLQYFVVAFYSLLIGSTLVAPEIASGAIRELFARPVKPWKIWLSKALFGVITALALLIVAELVSLLVAGAVSEHSAARILSSIVGDVPLLLLILVPTVFVAASLLTSNMTEQPILATVGAVLLLIPFHAYWIAWAFLLIYGGRTQEYVTVNLAIPLAVVPSLVVFLALSALVFTRGQINTGLRGPKWRLAGVSTGCVAVVMIVALAWGAADILRLGPHENFEVNALSVSPDRTKVAVAAHPPGAYEVRALWIVDLESGKRLFPGRHFRVSMYWHWRYTDWAGAWSPDSKKLAIRENPQRFRFIPGLASYEERVNLVDIDKETVREVRSFGPSGDWPYGPLAWSETGDSLYYVVQNPDRWSTEKASSDGTVKQTPFAERLLYPRRIVSRRPPILLCDYSDPQPPLEYSDRRCIYALLDPATGETKIIDLGRHVEVEFVDISPDARHVLYAKYDRPLERHEQASSSVRRPPAFLYLRDLSTGADKLILEDRTWYVETPYYGTVFSPDGTRFVLYDRHKREGADDRVDAYLVNIAEDSSTQLIKVIERGRRIGWSSWSPKGVRLAVAVDIQTEQDDVMRAWLGRTGRTELHVFTHGDGGFAETTIVSSGAGGFAWLSDDELLYADGNAVYRINADGTNKRKVFP
jgi:ABC-type transport system involved in multi-copper enzyme maturation permease subunit/Tol biopolymer transport system component